MGGHYIYKKPCDRPHVGEMKTARTVFNELAYHDNFKFPRPPRTLTPTLVAAYVLETVARFVSPSPKVEGEDNEYRCDDLARTIRTELKEEIIFNLREAYRKEAKDYEKMAKRVHKEMMGE